MNKTTIYKFVEMKSTDYRKRAENDFKRLKKN